MEPYILDIHLSPDEIRYILNGKVRVILADEAKKRISDCREFLDEKIRNSEVPLYGINTGFGSLCNTTIPEKDLEKLQHNLLVSHACGTGEMVPADIVRLMLLLKVLSLAHGNSGVHLHTVERLLDLYNLDLLPVIFEQGSLGASGDLAPLAHLSLPLIGLGEVWMEGKIVSAESALKKHGLKPLSLGSKEGLALINGTQFMSAYGFWIIQKAEKLSGMADLVAAISLDAFDCRAEPFHPAIHELRPHAGQIATAAQIRRLLEGSAIMDRPKQQVQDPYAFRCIPQVHGASKDVISHVHSVFLTEINGVTDNPNILPAEDLIISGGNFHGQPLAMALDYLCIALAELGSISERRTYQLISGQRGLPPFLVAEPGLNSGMMIPQYTAASIVSQNKQLCTPASVDSIVSSNGQEDHVSMGANAATKALRVVNNLEIILAIELLNAAQALEFRRPHLSSPQVEKFITAYRDRVEFIQHDKVLYPEIRNSVSFLRNFDLTQL